MAVLKEGTLTKRAMSATFFKTWKERRIVLRSRQNSCAAIGWYRPEETQPAGTLEIDHHTQVSRQGRNLLVRSSGKELYLYHKESAVLDEWHDAHVILESLDVDHAAAAKVGLQPFKEWQPVAHVVDVRH